MIDLFNGNGLCWTQVCSSKPGTGFFRTVSFCEQVRVNEIPNKKSLSRRERNALWYPEPTNGGVNNLIQQIMCGSGRERNGDGEEIEFGHDIDARSFPISAVLMEQETRRDSGQRVDPAEIAKIYHRCSSHSALRAQMRAVEFELDAVEYLCQPSRHGKQKIILLEERR